MRLTLFAALLLSSALAHAAGRQIVGVGSYPGDGTGDSPRVMGQKVNAMTAELYSRTDKIGTNGIPSSAFSAQWRNALGIYSYTSVKAYPYLAKGDGTTDDTAAIQAAVDAAGAGRVYLPAGVYLISDTLYLRQDYQTFAGDGRHCTYIKQAHDGVGLRIGGPGVSGSGVVLMDISFICTTGANQKIAVQLYDGRHCRISGVQTGPNFVSISGDSIGLQTMGRDLNVIRDNIWQADQPIVISSNPNSSIDLDHCWFYNNTTVSESANPGIRVEDTAVNISESGFIGFSINTATAGFYWHDSVLGARCFNLTLDDGRIEQGRDNDTFNVDIMLGTLDRDGIGGNVLDGLHMRKVFLNGFQEGVRLGGVIHADVDDVGFFEYDGLQTQLYLTNTCDWIYTHNCFSQQGATIVTDGMRAIMQSPKQYGNSPMSPEMLWVRGGGSTPLWKYSDMQIQGGLGVGTSNLPAAFPQPTEGQTWGVINDSGTTPVFPFLAMQQRDYRTNVARHTGYGGAEVEPSFTSAPVWTWAIHGGSKASTNNWYSEWQLDLNPSLTASANAATDLTKFLYADGQEQSFSLGTNGIVKDLLSGERYGKSLFLNLTNTASSVSNASPVEVLSINREVDGAALNPRDTLMTWSETFQGVKAYRGSIAARSLLSAANLQSALVFNVSTNVSAGVPAFTNLTAVFMVSGGTNGQIWVLEPGVGMQPVTFGTANSAGAGYRTLKVPN